ncbi:MAG TPA: hypothetical protein VGG98_10050 [Solirubrobacteraceae bacterium]|jgi:hypothetical protein
MFRTALIALVGVAALGTVASASASATPGWTVTGVKQKGGGKETTSSKGGIFHLSVAFAQNIQCTKEKDSGEISFTEPGTGVLKITLEGCTTPGLANCEVSDTGAGKTAGTIRTGELATELRTYAGIVYEHFQAPAFGVMTTIEVKNKEGKVCNAKGKFPVEGEDCAEVGPEAIALQFKLSQAIATKCGAKLETEGSADEMSGTSERTLTGAKKGLAFGVA